MYLGSGFLSFAKMQLDFATSSYTSAFNRSCQYDFEPLDFPAWNSHCFPCPEEVLNQLVAYTSSMSLSDSYKLDQLVLSFPKLFSDQLGTVKGMVCQLDLTDDLPVRSWPFTPTFASPTWDRSRVVEQRGCEEKLFQICESGLLNSKASGRISDGVGLSTSQ
jgi:hypothetical protein